MRAVTACATMGFLLFGYDRMFITLTSPPKSTHINSMYTEGVMSSIIDADPFNDIFTATKDNSTMQGVVTAIYELGTFRNYNI